MGIESESKRPCCRLLNELSKSISSLKDPAEATKALKTITEHCTLMKLMGQSSVKWDLSKSTCYLARSPDAQTVMDEIGKTAAVHSDLKGFYALLNHISGILANNAKLKQISSRIRVFLATLREGEKKFGRVPETSLLTPESKGNTLSAGERLKKHPKFYKKPQSEGIPPKINGDSTQNPEANKNAEELQLRLAARPTLTNAPKNAPTAAPTLIRK